jgi:GNAT superfamily N-acetyltransferase
MGRGTLELRNASPSAEIRFEVLEGFDATGQWLDEVCKASDAHRNELGFLARSIFEQFARREGLYVLLAHTPTGPQYAGHLLFDRHFPRAHVRQMFTLEPFRRFGAASQLLDHLRQSLTQSCFISIYARVAEDLIGANAFWHKQRFYVQRSVKGGATRNRQTLVRCHELDSPQLFPTSGLNDHNPLGLVEPAANELPMYLLDMNVLFDVQPRRLRRAEVAGLFQAERMNFCRLAISSEIRDELQRNLQSRHTDPMEA